MSKTVVPILAGGQGTRLWPVSRTEMPKQFLPWMGSLSLFQRTLRRVESAARYRPAIVVTHADYEPLVRDAAAEAGQALDTILLEPVTRNTAAAIAAAAEYAARQYGDDIVLHVMPSDHDVEVGSAYWQANDHGIAAARQGALVTFGISPTGPETGYGYIKSHARNGAGAMPVDMFVEKPNLERAMEMLEQGGFFWNSGMFMFKAGAILAEYELLAPDIVAGARRALEKGEVAAGRVLLDEDAFAELPDISIDFALFERTKKAEVVAADHRWADLGSWDGVWRTVQHDTGENFTQGQVTLDNVTGSLVITDHAHVAVHGLKDVAVVATKDAIFVTPRAMAQKVSGIVQRLRDNTQTRALTQVQHTAYRPWGNYASVARGERYQVKRIFVKSGQKLSLQKHHHRAEHWIVVKGTAEVTIDGSVTLLTENQSIFLPLGCVHRLANPGKIDLELIEVQTGSYLGEDDIVRLEDDYGRV